MFHVSEVEKDHPDLIRLVSELDAFQSELYPEESNHCLDFSTVSETSLHCIIAYDVEGTPAGCGALLFQEDGAGELKRIYIRPQYRGRKLGEQIVASLEKVAIERACYLLRLETGIQQQPAITLYRRCGYDICEAFPPYTADPLSVFMFKKISNFN